MSDKRVQYQPTPQLQEVVNALAPALSKTLKANAPFKLLAFSKYEGNPGRMTFYVAAGGKRFKLEIDQSAKSENQTSVKVLQAFEITTK